MVGLSGPLVSTNVPVSATPAKAWLNALASLAFAGPVAIAIAEAEKGMPANRVSDAMRNAKARLCARR